MAVLSGRPSPRVSAPPRKPSAGIDAGTLRPEARTEDMGSGCGRRNEKVLRGGHGLSRTSPPVPAPLGWAEVTQSTRPRLTAGEAVGEEGAAPQCGDDEEPRAACSPALARAALLDAGGRGASGRPPASHSRPT